MAMKVSKAVNVGIDIGKQCLDVFILERELQIQFSNDAEGIRNLLGRLGRYKVERIVVEATGRYERELVDRAVETRTAHYRG